MADLCLLFCRSHAYVIVFVVQSCRFMRHANIQLMRTVRYLHSVQLYTKTIFRIRVKKLLNHRAICTEMKFKQTQPERTQPKCKQTTFVLYTFAQAIILSVDCVLQRSLRCICVCTFNISYIAKKWMRHLMCAPSVNTWSMFVFL